MKDLSDHLAIEDIDPEETSRVTVMIGAMKPMTSGHFTLIRNAIEDSQAPEGVVKAKETYVLVSMQDRIKKGELPVRGETAISALNLYKKPLRDLFSSSDQEKIHIVFCHSQKFGRENLERVSEMTKMINDFEEFFSSLGNVFVSVQEVRSGPPDFLLELAKSRPKDQFILYTGVDDLNKYQYFKKFTTNVDFAGFERFEGGISGTRVRSLMQSDRGSEGFSDEELSGAFPPGVDPAAVRSHYRGAAGLDPLSEIKLRKLIRESIKRNLLWR